MTALVTRSQQSCSDNQKLLARARDLIHVSRRALNPSWTITGASVDYASPHPTPDDPWTMRLAIRQRLALSRAEASVGETGNGTHLRGVQY